MALTIALGTANATTVDPMKTTIGGSLGVGAGSGGTGPSPGGGINLHNDFPGVPIAGAYVTPWTPTGYDFAAPGNSHSLVAEIPDFAYSGVKLTAEIAPAGSGLNGLAVNHMHVDLWVADSLTYGRGAGASLGATSLLTKAVPNGIYGALHWEVLALPAVAGNPVPTIGLDLRLLQERAVSYSGPLTNASGNYAAGYPGWGTADSSFEGIFVSNIDVANYDWATGGAVSPGGRFLVDVWWAYSDSPIDPTMLAAVPEPNSWALMLGGVAFIGGLWRRRVANGRQTLAAE
jgi:hypothetical protein